MPYDVIVIGSGFGGAITGCRLAEAGYKVLILERGRRWNKTNYPRKPEDKWIWNGDCPEKENGWMELHTFRHMAVAQGAAVGGGSLIYANISCESAQRIFAQGLAPEITYAELQAALRTRSAKFMNVQPVPDNQWTGTNAADAAMQRSRSACRRSLQANSNSPSRSTSDWILTTSQTRSRCHAQQTYSSTHRASSRAPASTAATATSAATVDAKNTLDRNVHPAGRKNTAPRSARCIWSPRSQPGWRLR